MDYALLVNLDESFHNLAENHFGSVFWPLSLSDVLLGVVVQVSLDVEGEDQREMSRCYEIVQKLETAIYLLNV